MKLKTTCLFLFAMLHCAFVPVANADSRILDISIARAPVAGDGTTAGAVPDFVLTFADRDPAVDGISIEIDGTVEIILPPEFINTGAGGEDAIILQGWPQSPRVDAPGFPFTRTVVGNTISLSFDKGLEWLAPSEFGPGPKQVHLLLNGFESPGAGSYPISLSIDPDGPASDVAITFSGIGYVQIIPRARPAVNVVSAFSGDGPPPPFFNPFYQIVSQNDSEARQFGAYLWQEDAEPAVGVDLEMTNLWHGRLVQGEETVGQVRIQAPPGAMSFSLKTVTLPAVFSGGFGPPSYEVEAFATGLPAGLLGFQFHHDPGVIGEYAIDISMNGGNTERLRLLVTVDE